MAKMQKVGKWNGREPHLGQNKFEIYVACCGKQNFVQKECEIGL